MRFRLVHRTEYHYAHPASESVGELRVCPPDLPGQRVLTRRLALEPSAPVHAFRDYWGNTVEYFCVPLRHSRFVVTAEATVETAPPPPPGEPAQVPLGEAKQLYNSQLLDLFDYLQPTARVPGGAVLKPLRRALQPIFRSARPLGDVVLDLNTWINTNFRYLPGVTDVTTPVATIVEKRAGVCQDFAHLMLCILRAHGLPARYVSGYIEAFDPTQPGTGLVGAAASHAWVEVFLPGGTWWGLDPTNRQTVGERHVKVAVGRDYGDAAPMRGTYKGAADQRLNVIVSLERRAPRARRTTSATAPSPSAATPEIAATPTA